MAVRRVTHHGGNIIGKFPSLKMGRRLCFESTIERDYVYTLDFEANVLSFDEQPLTIEYQRDGKSLHYTPDFHIVYSDHRNALAECKPSNLVESDDNQRKFRAARAWCAERGWDFHVITDTQLRAGYRLQNIKSLTCYARHVIPPHIQGRVYAAFEATSTQLTVGDVAQFLVPQNPVTALAWIWHLAFHHQVMIPLETAPVSMQSPIALPAPLPLQQGKASP
ncbi:hypothetical protein ANRL3_01314 [Anaerolineae bacterium]|nr:hypothetical protein ANRL3_01314 [Anaerolineae bacterium]